MLIINDIIVAKYKNCTDCLGSSENERRHDKLEKNDSSWRRTAHAEILTLSSLNLSLSSSSTTSRELLSQFSTCSEWRWLEVGEKVKKIVLYW